MSATNLGNLTQSVRLAVREKRFPDALSMPQQAVEVDPDRAELYESLGTVCTLAGRDAEAALHFRRACALQPEKSASYVNLGAVQNRMGQHEEAVESLLKGVQRDSGSAIAFYNLGIAYKRLGQRAMAVSAYREAIRLEPRLVDAHQNLGNVYLDGGNVQQAIAQFKRALEINPDFDRAQRGLQRAEEARRVQSQETNNPFGRLVGPSDTHRIRLEDVQGIMSAGERDADRKAIKTIMLALRTAAHDVTAHVHSDVIPALDKVQGLIAQGRQSSLSFNNAHAELREATRRLAKLRRQLRARVRRLQAHEKLHGSPSESE